LQEQLHLIHVQIEKITQVLLLQFLVQLVGLNMGKLAIEPDLLNRCTVLVLDRKSVV